VELETALFFGCVASSGSPCPFEESALQVIRFLQHPYGFVIHDFSYEGMQAYRDLARSTAIHAVPVVRTGGVVSPVAAIGCVDPLTEFMCCELTS
jgi:hypothetical protein